MSHTTFAPVFTGLRFGLHALLLGLTGFTVVRAFVTDEALPLWVLIVGAAFVVVYLCGVLRVRARNEAALHGAASIVWIAALTVLWALLTWLSPEGAFLVFPLFFLYLRVIRGLGGVLVVAIATVFAIGALGMHHGFSVGGVLGPFIGASVALLIGLGYRVLMREAGERERLLAELLRTRAQLAATEREQGVLSERARLARDIHDTVAQGLSSIQMLLRAAERDAPEPSAGYVRLARETAAESLAETRQIIRELTPNRLSDGLAPALRRLGEDQAARAAVPIEVHAEDADLPMDEQTALLRIAQGALSNAVRHADASQIVVELTTTHETVTLSVRDNGRGFDTNHSVEVQHSPESFGLQAMRERVSQFDGELEVVSTPGHGAMVTARLPRRSEAEETS